MGARITYSSGYLQSCIGGIIILAYGLNHQDSWSFTFLILFAKFGISANGVVVYVAHPDTFPPLFAATAFGLCNVCARTFSTLSPVIAQMKEPLPMWLFVILSGIAAVLSLGLKVSKKGESKTDEAEEAQAQAVSKIEDKSNSD